MNYVINLVPSNFSRQLDEVTAVRLASVSGLYANFKFAVDSQPSRQTPCIFSISRSFSWQSLDLFLCFFSPSGRNLIWGIDNLVEFIHICSFFMVVEPFLSFHFRASIPRNFGSVNRGRFCEILFALKISGYLCLAHDLISFSSHDFEEVFVFEDLVAASSLGIFQCSVECRFSEIDGN